LDNPKFQHTAGAETLNFVFHYYADRYLNNGHSKDFKFVISTLRFICHLTDRFINLKSMSNFYELLDYGKSHHHEIGNWNNCFLNNKDFEENKWPTSIFGQYKDSLQDLRLFSFSIVFIIIEPNNINGRFLQCLLYENELMSCP
jgi:hypothetical protein